MKSHPCVHSFMVTKYTETYVLWILEGKLIQFDWKRVCEYVLTYRVCEYVLTYILEDSLWVCANLYSCEYVLTFIFQIVSFNKRHMINQLVEHVYNYRINEYW